MHVTIEGITVICGLRRASDKKSTPGRHRKVAPRQPLITNKLVSFALAVSGDWSKINTKTILKNMFYSRVEKKKKKITLNALKTSLFRAPNTV